MSDLLCCRASQSLESVQQSAAAEKEAQEPDRLHESTDIRAGKEISLPEILEPSRQGRDRRSIGSQQCPSDHVVPKQKSETQEGHGGAQEGRADRESASGRPASQDFSGERAGLGNSEETTIAKLHG